MRLFATTLAAVALAASIGTANAGTISYSSFTELNPVNVTIKNADPQVDINAGAGEIQLTTAFGQLSTFCFDIAHFLTSSGAFTTGGTVAGSLGNSINALLSHVLPTLGTDKDASAALQVAIWETKYQDISITSSNNSILSKATGYIQNVTTGSWAADPTKTVALLAGNGANQDQIYLTAVPEPASVGLLGFGLLGLLVMRRRARTLS